ncbi:MAG: V-type ATP synthase subunit I [Candidatus Caldatribacterium sp.]|nr:V-type ATP synthase subunit I [Candidatus Caldatribacterium sp.]MCX7731163.1 V-type ATP synthase subunit I [Candidatus Caldatribacterium sp.]MDW8081364.1 V-type ATP synthase subunit I [Candidatus Calescibacterium sp.]
MPISRMQRVSIVAHHSKEAEIVALLQDLGVFEISAMDDVAAFGERPTVSIEELERALGEIRYCLDFLNRYRPEKPSFLESFLPTPLEVSKREFLACSFNHVPVYRACVSLEERLNTIRTTVNRLSAYLDFLSRFTNVPVPLEDIGETRFTKSMLLEVPSEKKGKLLEELGKRGSLWDLLEFPGKARSTILFLVVHKDFSPLCEEVLQELGLAPVVFPQAFEGTPKEAAEKLQSRIQELMKEQEKLLEKAALYVRFERDLKLAHDYYASLSERRRKEQEILHTRETIIISGWARAEDVGKIEQSLQAIGSEWVLLARDPKPGEEVPVDLRNGPWTKNFEVLTRLYGLPNYWELDPTPFLAPFFFLFFGICLGDVIYGLILALLGFLAPKFLRAPEGAKRFFHMLGWGGIASIVVGMATGSWLGDTFDYLPGFLRVVTHFKRTLTVIDPITNPLPMLLFSLLLGLVQVLVGLLVSFVKEWRRKNYVSAILDQLGWFAFILAIVLYIGSTQFVLLKPIATPFLVGTALFLVATQGRQKKNPIMKILSGILSLYGVISYLGDVLSYSRLFALGLSSSIIAILARTLGALFGGSPYIGWLVGLFVALLFNLFNLVMSGLGAFVHSARLQYVEFFTKFYENGGREFQPFGYKTKYIRIQQ